MTHHGTPLKTMGLDLQRHAVTGSADELRRRCCGAAGAGTTASPRTRSRRWSGSASTRRATSRSRPATRATTCSRAPATDDDRRRPRELGIEPGQVAVLYAPTHREYEDGLRPGARPRRARRRRSDPDHVAARAPALLLRGGPAAARAAPPGPRARRRRRIPRSRSSASPPTCWSPTTRRIMFDYAVLDRPIVIHAPDWETYRAHPRHLLRPDDRGARASVTRTEDELRRPALARGLGRGGDPAARRVPRALLLTRGRPRRRARGPARVARRARAAAAATAPVAR